MILETGQLREWIDEAVAALPLGVFVWGVELQNSGGSAQANPTGTLLRIYIDADSRAVTLDDCEKVSREVSALLDVHDPIAGNYRLEVSSPGLDRLLFEPSHYARFQGAAVRINLTAPIAARKRIQGLIARVDAHGLVIAAETGEITVPFSQVGSARLQPRFELPAKPVARKPAAGNPASLKRSGRG